MSREPRPDERVEVLEKSTPFKGYFQVDTYRLRHRKFKGGWTRALTLELFERGHAAAVLLYDPERDAVVLIEQFRVGAYAAGREPWLIEIVAGIIEDGEDAAQVVRREAVEEAGCEILDLVPIGTVLPTPGGSSETLAFYCGRVDSRGAGGIHGLDHEGEDIRVLVLPAAKALSRVMAAECSNANAVIALQWLALNKDELRRRWGRAAP